MKALTLNSIIIIGMIMVTGSCEKNTVTPCVKGVSVQTHANCYLIVQILNAPIGKSYTYSGYGGQKTTYDNAIQTNLGLKGNYGDTIFFRYKNQDVNSITSRCNAFGNTLYAPPTIPSIEILSYSLKSCPQ
jgi:hypothetical protein